LVAAGGVLVTVTVALNEVSKLDRAVPVDTVSDAIVRELILVSVTTTVLDMVVSVAISPPVSALLVVLTTV
jgi:hypothetical protein